MAKSCKDCFHLRAKIPVENGVLKYRDATGYCRQGMLSTYEGAEPRIFKKILRNGNLKSFECAERCPCYDGD